MAALQALCVVLAESVPEQVKELQQRVTQLELELDASKKLAEKRLHMWSDAVFDLRKAKELLRMLLRHPSKWVERP